MGNAPVKATEERSAQLKRNDVKGRRRTRVKIPKGGGKKLTRIVGIDHRLSVSPKGGSLRLKWRKQEQKKGSLNLKKTMSHKEGLGNWECP